jgi:hypothetical protein
MDYEWGRNAVECKSFEKGQGMNMRSFMVATTTTPPQKALTLI